MMAAHALMRSRPIALDHCACPAPTRGTQLHVGFGVGQKELDMRHARVAVYKVKPGTVDEVLRKAEAGMLPVFQEQPGFVSYGAIKTGEDACISLTIWESR